MDGATVETCLLPDENRCVQQLKAVSVKYRIKYVKSAISLIKWVFIEEVNCRIFFFKTCSSLITKRELNEKINKMFLFGFLRQNDSSDFVLSPQYNHHHFDLKIIFALFLIFKFSYSDSDNVVKMIFLSWLQSTVVTRGTS